MSESSPRLTSAPGRHGASALLVSVVLAGVAVGCSSNPWKREVIYTYAGVTLYREYTPEGEVPVAEPYAHPVQLKEEPLRAALSELSYVQEYFLELKDSKTLKVFTAEEVRHLVPPLCLAMREVQPDERIRFLVSRSNWSELFTGPSGTAGVVFQSEPGVLNLAFDYLHEKLLGAEDGRPSQIVFRTDPVESTDGTPLVPPTGAMLHVSETGVQYPRWVLVDLEAFSKPPAPGEAGASTASTEPAPGEATSPAKDRAAEEEEQYQAVRSRVRMLQRLREDGLLSEEQYQRELERVLSQASTPPE